MESPAAHRHLIATFAVLQLYYTTPAVQCVVVSAMREKRTAKPGATCRGGRFACPDESSITESLAISN
jgi:uncharacterized Zn-binding protein involved in type VI secretion